MTSQKDAIADCLRDLRRALRWRSDVDDIIAELEDHLREAAARLADRGAGSADATVLAVERLGDPVAVARSFAIMPSGRLAAPTRFTRAAGSVALLAAGLWVLAGLLSPLGTDLILPWSPDRYQVWSGAVVLAAVASSAAVVGLLKRVGAGGRRTGIAVTALVAGTVGLLAGTWLWQVGAFVMAVGALLAITAARRHGISRPELYGLACGAPLGATTYLIDRLDGSPIDGAVASFAGFLLVAAAHAFALVRLGSWLRSETPADIDEFMTVA